MTDKTQKKRKTQCIDLTADEGNTSEMGSPTPSSSSSSNIEQLCEEGQRVILEGMKAVNAMPSGKSRDLYATHPTFIKIMDSQANKMLNIISNVLKMQGVKGNIQQRDSEEKIEMIQEFNDNILERIHSSLDEMAGIKKKAPTVLVQAEVQVAPVPRYRLSGAWNEQQQQQQQNANPIKATLITGTNIARPQANFKVPVDNSPLNCFVPKIREKPNSLKPLAVLPEYDEAGNIVSYLHPYELELDRFCPTKEAYQKVTPQEPLVLEETELVFIDQESQLAELLSDLRQAKEIAIDLEHHSYRSFQGFTCLMQLSTRTKDYIVDTLKLRDELHVLNEVFTDRKKLKVLHGAFSDVDWLQRDLGLYLVNMFDTAEAARVLQFSRIGLQFLLKHYCKIDTDKALQLADWRIRPLPETFIEYARKDTHYLLYICDRLRNELLEKDKNLLATVYEKSTLLCKQRYAKPIVNEDTIMNIYRRSRYVFDHRQMYALREILYWRDKIAREEDESTGYVLPQHMALDIASKLPREMQGILACCTPVPSLVRQNLHQLHQIVLKARDLAPVAKIQPNVEQQADTRHKIQTMYDFNNPLVCPHDDNRQAGITGEGANMPTLLGDLTNVFHGFAWVPQINMALLKRAPNMGVIAGNVITPINSRGQIGLNENDIGSERFAKLAALHYNEEKTSVEEGEKTNRPYERNKFNTPFERYQETCRLRILKEQKAEKDLEMQQIPAVRQDVGQDEDVKVIESQPAPATIIVVPDGSPEKVKPANNRLLTQKQLKRLEDAKLRKDIASGEKLCFSGTAANQKQPADGPKRKSFPFEINVSTSSVEGANDERKEKSFNGKPHMEPFVDPAKSTANDHSMDEADWRGKAGKRWREKQRTRNRQKAAINQQGAKQSSNKPVTPFDYSQVDFGRFQGGSKPLPVHRKGKRPAPGAGLMHDGAGGGQSSKQLHPNSRLAKGIKKTQKLFNLSSSNLKRK
ncbi:exosome component 10 [Anopheles ziemanni]|uniref:exosome component 10 n=1 Tax=Anopheles coustani TaxID=139045 RepID=UPI00265A7575|nr:exosome component 10 [Anopheles coustani]XP_058175351.1 exosome component 10 [Anopheles ziemanni]